ncbi:MAG: flagellar basal body rod protein FlgB [Acidobacteriaceae bacterium]
MPVFSSIDMLQGYLKVLTDRQQMIASNMANIDTPGYHTKDLNFHAAIRQVMDAEGSGSGPLLEQASFETNGLPERPDGNNVNIDRESMLMAQTQLQFQMGVNLVKSDLSMVMTAIKEGS